MVSDWLLLCLSDLKYLEYCCWFKSLNSILVDLDRGDGEILSTYEDMEYFHVAEVITANAFGYAHKWKPFVCRNA